MGNAGWTWFNLTLAAVNIMVCILAVRLYRKAGPLLDQATGHLETALAERRKATQALERAKEILGYAERGAEGEVG